LLVGFWRNGRLRRRQPGVGSVGVLYVLEGGDMGVVPELHFLHYHPRYVTIRAGESATRRAEQFAGGMERNDCLTGLWNPPYRGHT